MKISLKCIGVVAGILLLWSGGAWSETIQDAVKSTIKTNPELMSQVYNRLAKDQEVVQSQAAYYPTLNLSHTSSVDYQKFYFHDGEIEKVWPNSTILSLRQNIYRFGADKNEVARQEARVRSQAYMVQETSENVSLQATKAYLDVLSATELNELSKENLLNHERIYDQMKLRSTSGVDRKADLDQVVGRLALAKSGLVATNTNVDDAKTNYLAVIGHLPGDLTKPAPVGRYIPATIEEAEKQAVKDRPRVKSAQADLEAREFQYTVAKRVSYPKLDAMADYRWDTDVQEPDRRTEDFIVGITLSANLFNGFRDKARIEETSQLISEAKEILENTKRQTAQSVRLSWEAYMQASKRVAYLEEYANATGMTAEAFAKQWQIGRRTMFDLLDTQAEYINAKKDLVKAKYDKMYAEYRVLNGLGKLTKSLGVKYPAGSSVEQPK